MGAKKKGRKKRMENRLENIVSAEKPLRYRERRSYINWLANSYNKIPASKRG